MFDPPLAKKKAGLPPSPNILDYPDSMSLYERESLAAEANLLPREKLGNVRSLLVIQTSTLNLIGHHSGKRIAAGTSDLLDVAILMHSLAVLIGTQIDS